MRNSGPAAPCLYGVRRGAALNERDDDLTRLTVKAEKPRSTIARSRVTFRPFARAMPRSTLRTISSTVGHSRSHSFVVLEIAVACRIVASFESRRESDSAGKCFDFILARRGHLRLDPYARECFRLFRGIVPFFAWLWRRDYVFVHNALFVPTGTRVKLLNF